MKHLFRWQSVKIKDLFVGQSQTRDAMPVRLGHGDAFGIRNDAERIRVNGRTDGHNASHDRVARGW